MKLIVFARKQGAKFKNNNFSKQYFLILVSYLFITLLINTQLSNHAIAKELKEKNPDILEAKKLIDLKVFQLDWSWFNYYNSALYDSFDSSKTDYLKINSINTEASSLLQKSIEYTHQGYTRLALSSIARVIKLSKENQDLALLLQAQGVLGNIHFISGDYQDAIASYQQSLDLAQSIADNLGIIIAWNNLANTWHVLEQDYQAQIGRIQNNYQETKRLEKLSQKAHLASLDAANKALANSKGQINDSAVRAWINWHRLNKIAEVKVAIPLSILEQLPVSRSQIYLLIDLAQLSPNSAIEILQQGVVKATSLQDNRALSFALGSLGNTYEQKNQITQAIEYTEKAILTAQEMFAVDSLYRWQWQAGRLYKALGKTEQAKNYYREAIATLQSEQSETIALSKQRRWDFRDQVEPVYRELLELLLASNQTQEIKEALNVFELLNIKELKNFFEDDCVEITKIAKTNLEKNLQQTNTAIISSIVLPQQTYIILQLPDGTVKIHTVEITNVELSIQIQAWHKLLTNVATNRYLKLSQSLYDLLIRPLEKDLAQAQPDTLVLIQDGILRNVPLAALHDGQNFLIEKYPIANILGLNLITTQKVDQKIKHKVLSFGLTKAVENFGSLPNVAQEINNINLIIDTKKNLDEEFTANKFQEQIQQEYPIVHLATHGRFDGTVENSFIRAFDSRISLQQLESFLSDRQKPLDLLVLSACETSVGDNRSVLGLAGVLVRSGTKTAMGSLWSINDATTEAFMTDFYQNLAKQGMSKAAALRQAQLNQIDNPLGHPATWSAFIIIGNWQ